MSDKEFVCKRGFGKLISLFSEVMKKRGWEFFCEHKAPGFVALAREFYANMVGMKDDSVYVRGVWVPFDDKRINEVFKLRDFKHGSKYKKLLENPNYEKIVSRLTGGEGKWEVTKKTPHHAIKRGALTEEAKVWFYFICSVIVPTKHLCSVREQEAILLYAFLKGYKMNIGILIEESIRGYHHSNKRGLIPHPATITKLCFWAGVKGNWEEEERCPRVSPLTLTGVTRGPKGNRQKEVMVVDAETEHETNVENDRREMEEVPDIVLPEAEEEPLRLSPTCPLFPDVQEQVPAQAEVSRSREENTEIMEMLRAMKREMEERELKWERQQRIKEEFMEAAARRKEQIWEENWRIREEEHKEEIKKQEEKIMEKMKTIMQAFYNNQFRRDADLLNILKQKKTEMENNMMRKIDGFKHLYKELFKEFEKVMKERDQRLEDNDEYRRKTWLESMDLINQNLLKLLECISKVEGTVNQVGKRQDTLIQAVQLNNEISAKGKEIPPVVERQTLEMRFPKFEPSMASFDVDPPNIIPKKPTKEERETKSFLLACYQYIHPQISNGNPFGSSYLSYV